MITIKNTKHVIGFNVNGKDYHFSLETLDRKDALLQLRNDLAKIIMDINDSLFEEKNGNVI